MKRRHLPQAILEINRIRRQTISDETMRARIDNFVAALWSAGKPATEIDRLSAQYLEQLQSRA